MRNTATEVVLGPTREGSADHQEAWLLRHHGLVERRMEQERARQQSEAAELRRREEAALRDAEARRVRFAHD